MSETQPPDLVGMMRQIGGEAAQRMKLPPPVLVEMGTEVLHFDAETATLVCRFPVQERWQNPLGFMQGGIIAAAMDNTIGPLSFLVAPPSVTTQMNLSYLRPTTPNETHITVTAQLTDRTRRLLFFTAKAVGSDGKTLVVCNATQQLVE